MLERDDTAAGLGVEQLNELRARVTTLEQENDLLAIAAANEAKLSGEVQRLAQRVVKLEEENRSLKEANERLLQRPGGSGDGEDGAAAAAASTAAPTSRADREDPLAPFMVPGDRRVAARRPTHTLAGCHGGINVLCARVCPWAPEIVASGGADKSLLVSLAKGSAAGSDGCDEGAGAGAGGEELGRLRLAAPVLSMDACPTGGSSGGLLLAGCMDGKSHLVRIGPDAPTEDEGADGDDDRNEDDGIDAGKGVGGGDGPVVAKLLASMSDHSKYLVACRWAPDGSAFATASHDKVVTLYAQKGGAGAGVGGSGYEQATRFYMPEAVETVEFVHGEGGALELVISACRQPHLTYVNLDTMQQRKVSLNEKDWDTHVSFTVMSLAASPDGKYLLGATDKSRNFIWRAGSNMRVRTLMGQSSDEYFQPRAAWDPSGKFSYCNSAGDSDVHVHCLASGKVIERLKGHGTVVRDVHHHPSAPVLVTASYDKSVRVWGQ